MINMIYTRGRQTAWKKLFQLNFYNFIFNLFIFFFIYQDTCKHKKLFFLNNGLYFYSLVGTERFF